MAEDEEGSEEVSDNDGGPAFPMCGEVYGKAGDDRWTPGMSLRDYFAAAIVVHLDEPSPFVARCLMNSEPPQWSTERDYEQSAKCFAWWAEAEARFRYARADAMLRAREVKP